MRFLLINIIVLLFSLNTLAQTGVIRGKVTDEKNYPIAYASIYVIKASDSSNVMGAVTNETGQFIIEKLSFEKYYVRIKNVGSIDKWLVAEPNAYKPTVTFSSIVLNSTGKDLKEIEIGAERKLIENNIDKKTFTIDKSIISQSGSAVEAIEQIPLISTDENGNIQLRGSSSILILINGKPTGMKGESIQSILKQIPANSIEKIEVITNPSSKYDSEGANGIINIILKHNKNTGINGNINAQIGTKDKYNLSAAISYNKNNIGLNFSYGLRYNNRIWNGFFYRKVFLSDSTYYFDTDNNGYNRDFSQTASAGLDYNFNKLNSISFGVSSNFGTKKSPEYIKYTEFDTYKTTFALFSRQNNIYGENFFFNFNSQYKKTFKNNKNELSAALNYTSNNDSNINKGSNYYTLYNYLPIDSISLNRQNINFTKNSNFIAQTDYTYLFSNSRKLETGLKTTYRNYDNNMLIKQSDILKNEWFIDSSLSNHFVYSELINAAYVNFSGVYKNIGYQAGTRVEQTITDGELKFNNQKVGYNRIDFFPSFYLYKKIKTEHEFKVNYTRRIERPSVYQLNPFQDLSDPRNVRKGNPDLKPQFINNIEFDYVFTNKKLMTNPGIYYKQTNNLMWRYMTLENYVNYVTFENIGSSYNMGFDWITTYTFNKWLNTLTSLTAYYNRMKGNLGGFSFDNNNWNANLKQTATFKIKKVIELQFTYNYRTPFLTPQGESLPMQWLDFGGNLPIMKGKGVFTITLSDIFNTRKFGMELYANNMESVFQRKMESRILYIGFNYRFGKTTSSNKQKKKEQQEQRNEDMGF
ncbi:MAG: TonB-dependent receptor [Bacteroidetes bacterium]|nr:TonB-dependent receptor [Bacteroidota bacterium]